MSRRVLSAATALALVASMIVGAYGTALGANAASGSHKGKALAAGRYIVTLADDPVASYSGYKAGFPATRPDRGKKINRNANAVQRWQAHLVARHDEALAAVGAEKLYSYTVTNNGFAANLTARQAAKLAATPGVVALERDQLRKPTTTYSPEYLELDAAGGIWEQLAGGNPEEAGAGVVVGVLDTGVWPESQAFAGGTGIPIPAGWSGKCVSGERFDKNLACNDKLIGARYYVRGFNKHHVAKDDYLSPRDGNGHGTHTASTAAGNYGTTITIDGNAIDDGVGSGMAPGAKVAMYKVCWEAKPGFDPGCFNSDSVAAVNDAVLDGVDVLNFSIGGGSESDVFDSVAQAFRLASNAGVYVANSAGNSGPGASTFDHPAPWVTTVAAATFRRAFQVVELGNGARYLGASTTAPLTTATPLVSSTSVGLAGANPTQVRLCFPGTLDPALVAGKVVQCDRGVNARIEKSFEVERAGGVGMVLTNTSANSLNGDYHAVPSVHVDHAARAEILAYISAAGAGATAKIVPPTAGELLTAPQVPEIAAFSSRGPSTTTDGDILKPDIAAPGVDVVAAVAPPFNFGRSWDFLSGTSMASPHIAGIGALLKALHPDWLPSEIKSAMMTTARDTVSSANDPFAQGAGFVVPNSAADPGLVYPTTPNEYRSYLVSLGVQFAPPFDTLPPITASNLNQASISVGKLAGIETVERRVKNVGDSTATYTATVALPPGFDVTLTPGVLTLDPGEEGAFTVDFARTTAPLGEWAFGSLTWSDGVGHTVRSPIALQPVTISAPTEVHAAFSASGSVDYEVIPGFTGTLNTTLHGLVTTTPIADSVVTGPFDINNPTPDADTKLYQVEVSPGAVLARFSLDSNDDTADLDLYVYDEFGNFVDLSASGAADEEVSLFDPNPGVDPVTYSVYVNGFTTPGGSTSYNLYNFVVGPDDLPNSDVETGVAVTVGEPETLTATWTGLTAGRWLGVISYENSSDLTILAID